MRLIAGSHLNQVNWPMSARSTPLPVCFHQHLVTLPHHSPGLLPLYQLLDVMRTIISDDSAVPAEGRTVDYFVDCYILWNFATIF
jgi:hypothetical protein